MKKRILTCFAAAAAIACVLTACGSKGGADIDMKKLSADLQGTITSGSLAEVSSDILASTYFLDMEKIDDSVAALNSGASACEVAIVKCKDSDYVKEAEQLFHTRVDNQSALFADYNAPEVAKLDDALIASSGDYVVLCVTDDPDSAQSILKEAGF